MTRPKSFETIATEVNGGQSRFRYSTAPFSEPGLFPTSGGYKHKAKGTRLFLQGDPAEEFFVIQSGWVCLYLLREDGRRQIIDFGLPGDVVGLSPSPGFLQDSTAQTVTDVVLAVGSNDQLGRAAKQSPELLSALYAALQIENRRAHQQELMLATMTAEERIIHLLLGLFLRLKADRSLKKEESVPLPLTQQMIGDATGLTSIHVNRMLRQLQQDDLLLLKNGVLTILDPKRLLAAAHFDPLSNAQMEFVRTGPTT